MQNDKHFYPGKAVSHTAYQMGGYMNYGPVYGHVAPDIGPIVPMHPDFQLRPSEVCPKNFIIFDQTDNKSRIMYHPGLKHKFTGPSPSVDILQGDGTMIDPYTEKEEFSSSLREDTKDIDALMSLEEDDFEEDDEVMSTGRTLGNYKCSSSPDSCSKSSKSYSGCSSSSSNENEKQRKRMKKMVKALRGIVPGAENMTTASLIDEAVTYLKSLKVEVKNLGLADFNN